MRYTMKNILYATDLGPRGPDVFRHVTSLAEKYEADIHIIHVVEPLRVLKDSSLYRYVSAGVMESIEGKEAKAALSKLQQRLERFCRDYIEYQDCQARVASAQVLEGSPAKTILARAERVDADCIVLGSRRYSTLGEMVIGSVARKVTMESRRPVFLVPI